MAKVSEEAKQIYANRIQKYKNILDKLSSREKNLESVIASSDSGFEVQRFALSELLINKVSFYLLMNALSEQLLGIKNDGFLNEARKLCSVSIMRIEDVVSSSIDPPLSELKGRWDAIMGINDIERFRLINKLGFSLASVKDAFGEVSKWKWAFVDLEARFAVVSKNILDLREIVAKLDPRIDGYRERLLYVDMVKRLLAQAADRYRERYELSTQRLDDFRKAILFLESYKRFNQILGNKEEVESTNRKIDVWKTKMEDDEKRAKNS
ncbi:hypothetical protein WKV44_09055 [Spirochaetia bacterium 38H-sp]|uniref:Uncharacterized protein n=1 Tax=Rarispira pelagica TaxID=3141764 RepID=A0ABU9UDE4_9SPIR